MKTYLIVTAAGNSTRFNTNSNKHIKKEFILCSNGRSVLHNAIANVAKGINSSLKGQDTEIIITYKKGMKEETNSKIVLEEIKALLPSSSLVLIQGGETRSESTKLAIDSIKDRIQKEDIIITHDAARPFVSEELTRALIKALDKEDAAIPYLPLKDSIKLVKGTGHLKVSSNVDRNTIVRVQSPQVFRAPVLVKAFKTSYDKNATDDSQIVTNANYEVCLIEGEENNIKVTTASDIRFILGDKNI